ncbi:conserved hypothetical protein [Trichinella spiralis]|uniref:hypothetical protein n=1 Tax=Trichinella spiralis TaxID=6334 RepID=UPI0001EFDC72|nr:conserved hypothetical protein [Trichinella spiralis]
MSLLACGCAWAQRQDLHAAVVPVKRTFACQSGVVEWQQYFKMWLCLLLFEQAYNKISVAARLFDQTFVQLLLL